MPSHFHRMMDEHDKSEKSKPAKSSKLKHIHIEKAENGFTVSHRLEEKPSKGGKMPPYEEPKQSVFQSKHEVLKHVGKLMGDDDAREE